MKPTIHPRYTSRKYHGFTLIEVMIAMVIVGILAAIAYPSYRQHVLRSNRAEAKAVLMEAGQFMERYFTTNNGYVGTNGLPPGLPSSVSPKGAAGSNVKYNILFAAGATANAYTLQAVPTGGQAADTCGTLTLNQSGARTPATSGCW